jgi:intron-binding protein aquarius
VAVYQYMRLCGYPGARIAILTTYNGQKALIRDVLKRRCAPYGVFGEPAKVETVDKFQGQQADYILLSLVRTRAVGHLRDVRRLVVAMSRARLGLYVFGRAGLFANCLELQPAFAALTDGGARAPALQLLVGEGWPTGRASGGGEVGATAAAAASGGALVPVSVTGVDHMGAVVSRILAAQMAAAGALPPPPPVPQAPSSGPGGRRVVFGVGVDADDDDEGGAGGRDYEAGGGGGDGGGEEAAAAEEGDAPAAEAPAAEAAAVDATAE